MKKKTGILIGILASIFGVSGCSSQQTTTTNNPQSKMLFSNLGKSFTTECGSYQINRYEVSGNEITFKGQVWTDKEITDANLYIGTDDTTFIPIKCELKEINIVKGEESSCTFIFPEEIYKYYTENEGQGDWFNGSSEDCKYALFLYCDFGLGEAISGYRTFIDEKYVADYKMFNEPLWCGSGDTYSDYYEMRKEANSWCIDGRA